MVPSAHVSDVPARRPVARCPCGAVGRAIRERQQASTTAARAGGRVTDQWRLRPPTRSLRCHEPDLFLRARSAHRPRVQGGVCWRVPRSHYARSRQVPREWRRKVGQGESERATSVTKRSRPQLPLPHCSHRSAWRRSRSRCAARCRNRSNPLGARTRSSSTYQASTT